MPVHEDRLKSGRNRVLERMVWDRGHGARESEVKLELEFLVNEENEDSESWKLGQIGNQLSHVGLRYLPAQHRVADSCVDTVGCSESEAVDVVSKQRDLAHEMESAMKPLDE